MPDAGRPPPYRASRHRPPWRLPHHWLSFRHPAATRTRNHAMNRWKAFALHLALSLVVISGIAAAALLVWYPHGLYRIAGLDRLMVVMFCIDVVAGPLLTLLVYKKGKPSLRMDLAVVSLVQLAFLGYGLHTLWQSRPVFLVASDVRINLVFANEIDPAELARAARPEWRRLSWTGPQLVGVLPPSGAQRRQLIQVLMASGRDQDQLPGQYVDFEQVRPLMLANALRFGGDAQRGRPEERSVPIYSRFGNAWMLVDPVSGEPRKLVQR